MSDAQNAYADAQSIGSGAAITSTNVIDHGTGGTGLSHGMYIEVLPTTTWEGPTAALTFILEEDNDEAFGGATTIRSWTASDQTPNVGTYIVQEAMPTVTKRYTRMRATWTTNATAGAWTAWLTDSPQATWTGV